MPFSNALPVQITIVDDHVHVRELISVTNSARFPFADYGQMEAALSFVARAGARSSIQSPEDLEIGLRAAHEHLFEVFLVTDEAPVVQIERRPLAPKFAVTFDRCQRIITAHSGKVPLFVMPLANADFLAAAIAHREDDRFQEARYLKEIETRRQLWTAACIAAAGALPCSGQLFVEAAETMAYVIDPTVQWSRTPESYRLRTLAAIHAGVILFDARTQLFVAHPCMEGWRATMAPKRTQHWHNLRRAGMKFLMLPERLKQAIRAWAHDRRGTQSASSHELMAAEEAMAEHEAELAFVRDEIYPHLASVALAPPIPPGRF